MSKKPIIELVGSREIENALAEISKSPPLKNTTSTGAFILVSFALFQFIAYFKAFNLKAKTNSSSFFQMKDVNGNINCKFPSLK